MRGGKQEHRLRGKAHQDIRVVDPRLRQSLPDLLVVLGLPGTQIGLSARHKGPGSRRLQPGIRQHGHKRQSPAAGIAGDPDAGGIDLRPCFQIIHRRTGVPDQVARCAVSCQHARKTRVVMLSGAAAHPFRPRFRIIIGSPFPLSEGIHDQHGEPGLYQTDAGPLIFRGLLSFRIVAAYQQDCRQILPASGRQVQICRDQDMLCGGKNHLFNAVISAGDHAGHPVRASAVSFLPFPVSRVGNPADGFQEAAAYLPRMLFYALSVRKASPGAAECLL